MGVWRHAPHDVRKDKRGVRACHKIPNANTGSPLLPVGVTAQRPGAARGYSAHGRTATATSCPVLNQVELFPPELLTELNERVKRSHETSIIVQTYRKTQNQRQYDNRQPRPWQSSTSTPKDWSRSDSCEAPIDVDPPSPLTLPATGVPFEPKPDWLGRVAALQKLLDAQKRVPVGGRLKFFWKKWKAIGAPKKVYSWLRRGYKLPFTKVGRAAADNMLKTVCPDFLFSKYGLGSVKQQALTKLVEQLLEKGAIARVPVGTPVVFNRVFLRPKLPKPRQVAPEFRLIIDLSEVNKFLKLKTFTMDTPNEMRKHIETDLWGTSLDLSDAYHHIPIRADFHKFLAFQVGDQQYWYTVCPFGLSPIPQVFTGRYGAAQTVCEARTQHDHVPVSGRLAATFR